ncbi:MAG: phosphatidylglycerol lysyltransferase domain-containing protein [Armatimonadota bacterium]
MLQSIPSFPQCTPLDVVHKPALDALLGGQKPRASELTFTNLYIWRHAYGAMLTRFDEVVCVLSWRSDPEDSFLLPPLGAGASVEHVRACLDLLRQEGHDPKLCRTEQSTLDRLGVSEQEFQIEADRDDWDYVYCVPDLIDLPEDRYPEKARHVKQFSKRFKYEYRPITPELVPACQELQDLWCDDKHCDLYSSLRAEARAVKEILERLEELNVKGGAILVNNRVQAFALGEPLNDDTVVIHIEKASPDLHGAFQVINQEFLRHEWADWQYVNREQDVGDPGLRKAKESYLPVRMIEKFTVRPR